MAYFWDPLGKGCKLVDGVDYFTADGAIAQEHANTTNTSPAYERLTNGNGEIRIVLTFGADHDEERQGRSRQEQGLQRRKLPGHAQVPAESRLLGAHRPRRRARA